MTALSPDLSVFQHVGLDFPKYFLASSL